MSGLDLTRVRQFSFFHRRERESEPWGCTIVETRDRKVEVYVSPVGRSTRVYVDGKEIK